MSNNVYVDKKTGEQVKILQDETNFYVLDNSVRIKKDVFDNKYTQKEEIDPSSFFKSTPNADPLAAMAEQLKSIDTSKIKDAPSAGAQIKYVENPVVLSDNSLPPGGTVKQPQMEDNIQLTPAEKKKMLEEWRKTHPGAQIPEVQEKDDDERFLNGDKNKPIAEKLKATPVVDPIKMMFGMFKNNYKVNLNINLEENIANPTFIAMVQENVEADAVEYYANLISDKYLKNPDNLRKEVYKQLKSIINKELGIEDEEKNDNEDEQK